MGKPTATASDYITLAVVSHKYLPLSRATLTRMCQDRIFKTAWKPGRGKSSPWRVHRAEVIEHHINFYPEGF